MNNEIKNFILDYIQREYTIPSEVKIDELNFIKEGYINSLGLISFILEIEEAYGIEFSDEEIVDSSFGLIGQLVDNIKRKVEDKK